MIGLFGDDPNDYMAKCGAKWLHKNGVNVLCMSPGKNNYSHIRDFFADNRGKSLEDAIKCWKYKKQMRGHNCYSRADLIALE